MASERAVPDHKTSVPQCRVSQGMEETLADTILSYESIPPIEPHMKADIAL